MKVSKTTRSFFGEGTSFVLRIPPKARAAMLALRTSEDQKLIHVIRAALLTYEIIMHELRAGGTIHVHRGGGNFVPLDLSHINEPSKKRGPFSVIKGGKDD